MILPHSLQPGSTDGRHRTIERLVAMPWKEFGDAPALVLLVGAHNVTVYVLM
jgi:hypothetical protein